jgi:hypothetical protein
MNREAEDRFFRTAPDVVQTVEDDKPASIAPQLVPPRR